MQLLEYLLVMVVCLSLGNAARQHVIGRCCATRQGGGRGCPGIPEGIFQPPIMSEEIDVSWETQDLDCPLTQTVVYYNLSDLNTLIPIEEELILLYQPHELFRKKTREYCVEAHGQGYRGAVCQPDPEKICDNAVCIPKCCGEGEVLDQNLACTKGPGNMSLQFSTIHGKHISAPTDVVIVGDMMPDCGENYPTVTDDTSQLHLLPGGNLFQRDDQVTHEFKHYCIEDIYMYEDNHIPLYVMCHEGETTVMIVKHYLQRIGYVISLVFLVATILFHIFIPSLQDTQGLCLVSHMIAMAVTDIFLFILSLSSYTIPRKFCIFSGFVLLYSFLAMFFWLNIMCFDVWRVIRDSAKGIPLRGIMNNETRKRWLYSLYGWGCPLVVTVVAAIMHTLPEKYTKNITLPGIGRETCWLKGEMELLVYCYAYVAAIFVLDFIFLGHAMFMLFQAGSAFMCFTRQVSGTAFNRKHLEAFWQRFTLFILMVLCWTTELLSWKIPPREMWIVTDFLNSMQGFLVFVIFLSNKKRRDMVRKLLKKTHLPCFKTLKEADPLTSTRTNVNSPSGSSSGPKTSEAEISLQVLSLSKTDSDNK